MAALDAARGPSQQPYQPNLFIPDIRNVLREYLLAKSDRAARVKREVRRAPCPRPLPSFLCLSQHPCMTRADPLLQLWNVNGCTYQGLRKYLLR